MNAKWHALQQNQSWFLFNLPKGKSSIGCKCVYMVNYHANDN